MSAPARGFTFERCTLVKQGELFAASDALRSVPPTDVEAAAAAVAVAGRAVDADEAAELLGMLGLFGPSDALTGPGHRVLLAAAAGLRAGRSQAISEPVPEGAA
jgi:hypothetical protein